MSDLTFEGIIVFFLFLLKEKEPGSEENQP